MKEILAADQIGFPLLSALVVLPIAIAILLQCLRSESAQRHVALAGAILELALAVFIVIQFVPGGPVEQMIAQITGENIDATARVGGQAGQRI